MINTREYRNEWNLEEEEGKGDEGEYKENERKGVEGGIERYGMRQNRRGQGKE